MSDRVYRDVHNHGAGAFSPGVFPKTTFAFAALPSDGDTLTINTTATGARVVLTFTDDSVTGASAKRLHNGIDNTNVYIGENLVELHANIFTCINTSDYLTRVGTTDSITATRDTSPGVVPGVGGVVIYENEKIAGNVTVVFSGGAIGAGPVVTAGVSTAGYYTTEKMYSGIQSTTTGAVNVLMRDMDTDGYNIGPPTNQLTAKTIYLQAGIIHPIQTFGCDNTVNVYS